MDNTEEFRCISLCTGYAGLEMGLKRAIPTLRTVCYVEVEAFACANLVAKIEAGKLDVAPIWTDIKTFDGRPFRKRVHIVTAGYPCQPFSVAGKRQGTDDPRHLWPYIERIVETVKPVWCFFENVPGHLTLGFPAVYRSLRDMGYKVEAGLFTAAECGAPHRRQRLFILANSTKRWRRWSENTKNIWEYEKSEIETQRPSELENSSRATSGNQDGQTKRRTRQEDVSQGNGQAGTVRIGAASELADTTAQRIQGTEPERAAPTGRQADQQSIWPSRPGQPQYEWEEPRVVGYSKTRFRTFNKTKQNKSTTGIMPKRTITKDGQAQSRLGRAANGTRSRLDKTLRNDDEYDITQTEPEIVSHRKRILRLMWEQGESTTTSFGTKGRFIYCDMPKVSYGDSYEGWKLGQRITETKELCNLWERICTKTQYDKNLQQEMLEQFRQIECKEEMGQRVDRLRLLGNGVVPQQAELAFRELVKLF